MVTKSKALYQVKLILDYLPEEEYKLIPQETIDYIEENFEYDEEFIIDPKKSLEKQKIDDKAYDVLEKIIKQIKNTYSNKSFDKYNNSFEKDKIIKINNLIEYIRKENNKMSKAKELLEEYKEVLNEKDNEIEKLRKNNQELNECIQKIPKFIRKLFLKD